MSKSNFMAALEKSFENDCNMLSDLDIPQFEVSDEFQRKMSKLIERQKKTYFKLICTASRRVACIVVIMLVIFVSSLSVKAVRKVVFNLFMNAFSDHTEISVNIDDMSDYPETIETEYIIDNIPEGYELTEYDKNNNAICYYYMKEDSYIFFEQILKTPSTHNVDNEFSSMEKYTDDNGQEYFIHILNDDFLVMWDNGEYIFRTSSNLDKNSTMDLCKCTKRK